MTWIQCVNGHVAPRAASDGKCTVCKWLSWEKSRRSRGEKPFQPNTPKRAAEKLGERYFHGNPCPHGHKGLRWTHNGACVDCTVAASRQFQLSAPGIEYAKAWREKNIDKIKACNRNAKSKRKGAEGTHTAVDVREIIARQKYKCAECGCSVRKKNYRHVDHMMPLARGGTNWPSNLQILCPPCNLSKNAKDPIDWARSKGRLL